MKNVSLTRIARALGLRRLPLLAAACVAFAALPLLARTAPRPASISVVNNSALEIRHLYLSPPDSDDWGPDQLNNSVIRQGETYTLGVSCSQSEIKLVAEDQNGCFVTEVVACENGTTWTIPAGVAPYCGN
jgi:hypothetical protein